MGKNRHRGFTIIEVMIVLAIAGLIMIVIFLGAAALKKNLQNHQAHKDLNTISAAAQLSRTYLHQELRLITGSGCSDCACRTTSMQDPTCISNWQNAAARISINGQDINNLTSDPWGSPYALDENEGEMGVTDCRLDIIRSAGPDGILASSDDISVRIPLLKNPCP